MADVTGNPPVPANIESKNIKNIFIARYNISQHLLFSFFSPGQIEIGKGRGFFLCVLFDVVSSSTSSISRLRTGPPT